MREREVAEVIAADFVSEGMSWPEGFKLLLVTPGQRDPTRT